MARKNKETEAYNELDAKKNASNMSDGMLRFNRVSPGANVLFSALFIFVALLCVLPVLFVIIGPGLFECIFQMDDFICVLDHLVLQKDHIKDRTYRDGRKDKEDERLLHPALSAVFAVFDDQFQLILLKFFCVFLPLEIIHSASFP